jgi:hypothetical protein
MNHSLPPDCPDVEDLHAVREALAEWRAGDPGTPVAEAFDAIRNATKSAGDG